MKKIVLTSTAMCFAILMCQNTHAQNVNAGNANAAVKRCGQIEYENYLRSQDPDFDKKRAEVEKAIQAGVAKFEQSAKGGGNPQPFVSYTIPIVYHVLWNTNPQNVTDAKVLAMHDQLNKDWSRTNTDAGNTPPVWQPPIAANMEIQFCLATKDPSGNTTTGIVHKNTTVSNFSTSGDPKFSSQGGDDAWNVNQYLNIWICNMGQNPLGYATFPPLSSTYGTVVDYCTVGSMTNPGICPPFEFGRTLSHEIGHNFTLNHIWGGGGSSCTDTDNVADTPNQAGSTFGCPAFPKTDACSPSTPGIMFMNYMDYSDDDCYNMFTAGQKTRSQSAITTYLMSLVNSVPTVCGASGVNDLSLADNISLFPNPSRGEVFITTESNIHAIDLKVYNAIGKAVVAKKINVSASGETKINLSNNPDGIYLFELKTSEETITKKIIINRQYPE